MKETGILRRIDELGRIVVPKEIRKKLKIREGDSLDIFVSDDYVILKKYSPLNDLELILSVLLDAIKRVSNITIVVTDLTKVISSNKSEINTNDQITEPFLELLYPKEEVHINKSIALQITNEYKTNQNILIKPLVIYGDLFGSIVLFSEYETQNIQQEFLDIIHYFCFEYLQIE